MNWKLIFLLSFFGVAMAFATVYVIPSNIEPLFWLAIFVICAWLIATRAPGRYFLHGLMVSIINSFWITAAHVLLFDAYVVHHAREAEMMKAMPLEPHMMMLVTGPVVGAVSGLILGFFAWIAHKVIRRAS